MSGDQLHDDSSVLGAAHGLFASARAAAGRSLSQTLPSAVTSAIESGRSALSASSWFASSEERHTAASALLDRTERSLHTALAFTARLVDASVDAAQLSLRADGATADVNADAALEMAARAFPEMVVASDALGILMKIAQPMARAQVTVGDDSAHQPIGMARWFRCLQALYALHRYCPREFHRAELTLPAQPSPHSRDDLHRYALLAQAVYDGDTLASIGRAPDMSESSQSQSQSQPPPTQLLSVVRMESKSELCRPAYAILVDAARHELIVCIRGTAAVADALTDVVCQSVAVPSSIGLLQCPLDHQHESHHHNVVVSALPVSSTALDAGGSSSCDGVAMTHEGILKSALALDALIRPIIHRELVARREASAEPHPWRIVLTGHSLGGGVAALLCEIWTTQRAFARSVSVASSSDVSPVDESASSPLCIAGAVESVSISAVSFGAPCVLSLCAARAAAARVTTVICDDDLVTRASLGSVADLARALVVLAAPARRISSSGTECSAAGMCTDEGIAADIVVAEVEADSLGAHVLTSIACLEQRDKEQEQASSVRSHSSDECDVALVLLRRAARSVSAIEHAPHRLFAPGALVMLSALSIEHPHIPRPDSSAISLSGSANASASSSSPPPSSSAVGVPIDQLALARVVLSPSMLRAHAASNYVAACENIAWHQ